MIPTGSGQIHRQKQEESKKKGKMEEEKKNLVNLKTRKRWGV